ncbi:MgtC/SapB family protein [Streptomyces xiaopingdaonensis]|uniref:MgtC/SapB family protein n=1 Tax=Streptomyces xiaopingdaonensis TaxID=1565415 RepID=UPI00031FFB4C|nr:MgtC/SapB family protein [Streptomyces xiaopingdaonensis]
MTDQGSLTQYALTSLDGQGWKQVGEFGTAFVLSALIGLEREVKQKAAGLRTYTVVGFASALFMLVSKYGFGDVLSQDDVVLDPSRVAAQIVSGLGFIGGGIIFVKRDAVRGLTTAASIWLTAAVGAAAGAGLLLLALLATAGYFVAILLLPYATRWATDRWTSPAPTLNVHYLEGRGLLREVLSRITDAGFVVADVSTSRVARRPGEPSAGDGTATEAVTVQVGLEGAGEVPELVTQISELEGVLEVYVAHDESTE